MKQVFVSYSRQDSKDAKRLYDDLSVSSGLKVWFDRIDLLPGVEWRPAIRKAIRESDYFIALLSKKAVTKRGFRHNELREAIDVWQQFPEGKVFMLPARLDDCRMPLSELERFNYVDLFDDWEAGVNLLRTAMRVREPSKKRKKVRTSRRTASFLKYEYRVGLADLDIGLTNLRQIARELNNVQSFFHFTLSHLETPKRAVGTVSGERQLKVHRLPNSFFKEDLAVDFVLCMTRHFLMFEESDALHYNYLGAVSPVDDRFIFLSVGGLYAYAKQAGVKFEVALVYSITAEVMSYFGGLYHDETRGCPMDRVEVHEEIVEGLKKGRFCGPCRKQLRKNKRLLDAASAMLAWGRSQ